MFAGTERRIFDCRRCKRKEDKRRLLWGNGVCEGRDAWDILRGDDFESYREEVQRRESEERVWHSEDDEEATRYPDAIRNHVQFAPETKGRSGADSFHGDSLRVQSRGAEKSRSIEKPHETTPKAASFDSSHCEKAYRMLAYSQNWNSQTRTLESQKRRPSECRKCVSHESRSKKFMERAAQADHVLYMQQVESELESGKFPWCSHDDRIKEKLMRILTPRNSFENDAQPKKKDTRQKSRPQEFEPCGDRKAARDRVRSAPQKDSRQRRRDENWCETGAERDVGNADYTEATGPQHVHRSIDAYRKGLENHLPSPAYRERSDEMSGRDLPERRKEHAFRDRNRHPESEARDGTDQKAESVPNCGGGECLRRRREHATAPQSEGKNLPARNQEEGGNIRQESLDKKITREGISTNLLQYAGSDSLAFGRKRENQLHSGEPSEESINRRRENHVLISKIVLPHPRDKNWRKRDEKRRLKAIDTVHPGRKPGKYEHGRRDARGPDLEKGESDPPRGRNGARVHRKALRREFHTTMETWKKRERETDLTTFPDSAVSGDPTPVRDSHAEVGDYHHNQHHSTAIRRSSTESPAETDSLHLQTKQEDFKHDQNSEQHAKSAISGGQETRPAPPSGSRDMWEGEENMRDSPRVPNSNCHDNLPARSRVGEHIPRYCETFRRREDACRNIMRREEEALSRELSPGSRGFWDWELTDKIASDHRKERAVRDLEHMAECKRWQRREDRSRELLEAARVMLENELLNKPEALDRCPTCQEKRRELEVLMRERELKKGLRSPISSASPPRPHA